LKRGGAGPALASGKRRGRYRSNQTKEGFRRRGKEALFASSGQKKRKTKTRQRAHGEKTIVLMARGKEREGGRESPKKGEKG